MRERQFGTPEARNTDTTSRRRLIRGCAVGLLLTSAGCLGDDQPAKDFATSPDSVSADTVIIWFWGDGCPVCADQRPFLEELDARDDVAVIAYEVYDDQENQAKFQEVISEYELSREAVPTTFVGDRYWIGDSEQIRERIELAIDDCTPDTCSSTSLLED